MRKKVSKPRESKRNNRVWQCDPKIKKKKKKKKKKSTVGERGYYKKNGKP
jgi:hypothetical protein